MVMIACLGITLSSYEHGPAYEGGINRTGSTGGAASCSGSGCHDVNSPETIVSLSVYDAAGMPVTQYTPGAMYTVAIRGHHTSSLSLTEFGFQVSAVTTTGVSQAGTFSVASGSGLRVTELDALQIVEHKKSLDDSAVNHFVAKFSWKAPSPGAGNVSFHGILNPFGGEDEDDDDDDEHRGYRYGQHYRMDDDEEEGGDTTCPNVAPILLLTEGSGNATGISNADHATSVLLYPNPCSDVLYIETPEQGDIIVHIYSLNGGLVYTAHTVSRGALFINDLPSGLYQVEVSGSDVRAVRTLVKQ